MAKAKEPIKIGDTVCWRISVTKKTSLLGEARKDIFCGKVVEINPRSCPGAKYGVQVREGEPISCPVVRVKKFEEIKL